MGALPVVRERQDLIDLKPSVHGIADRQTVAFGLRLNRADRLGKRADITAGQRLTQRPFAGARRLFAFLDLLDEGERAVGVCGREQLAVGFAPDVAAQLGDEVVGGRADSFCGSRTGFGRFLSGCGGSGNRCSGTQYAWRI